MSSYPQIGSFCLPQTAGTIRFPALLWATRATLRLIDTKPTGNAVEGKSGTAKSLAYSPSKDMLYVVHSFGPDHIRLMSVSSDGKLTPRGRDTRVTRQTSRTVFQLWGCSHQMRNFFLLAPTFDVPIAISGTYPDGSPILWVSGPNGETKSVASNAPDPDGIVIHRVNEDGTLGEGSFQDGGGGSPFYIAFLHNRPDTFIIGYAVGDGVALGRIDEDGRIGVGKVVPIDTRRGKIAELCWASVSPDDRLLYATVFGYSNITTFHIDGLEIRVAKDPRARSSRAMARPGVSAATSPVARATTGSRRTAHFCIKSMGMRRSWWGTPLSRMARWRR